MQQLVLPIVACHLCGATADTFGDHPAVCRACIALALERADDEDLQIQRRLAQYTHDCAYEGCVAAE